ncbi:MAG: hypothetical protein LBE03_00355 [Candidatus Nomurabacteria bacterium]|jgi:hypothetical protein|nr:hypothetical protein [Candidatus Nomurabacteria bacterium]
MATTLNFNARIDDDKTRIEFRDETSFINIINSKDINIVKGDSNSIYFLIKDAKLVYIGKTDKGFRNHSDKDFDKYIIISVPKGVDISYLEYSLVELAHSLGIILTNSQNPTKPSNVSLNKEKNADDFIVDVRIILEKFGFDFFKERKYSRKHRLSTSEKIKEYKNYKIITIGGRMTRIYINNDLYDGNMQEKLREIAKDAGVDFSDWSGYKRKGTVHFAMELMKHLP